MKKLLLVIMITLAASYVYLRYYQGLDIASMIPKSKEPETKEPAPAQNTQPKPPPASHTQIKSTVTIQKSPAPPPANLVKDVADAQQKFDALKAACLARLAQDDQYRAAKKDADDWDAKIKVLRLGNDQDALSDMSQHWVEAKGRLESLQLNAIAADPQVQAAAKELSDRKAALMGQQHKPR